MKNMRKSNWISVPQVGITLQRDLWNHQARLVHPSYFWAQYINPLPTHRNLTIQLNPTWLVDNSFLTPNLPSLPGPNLDYRSVGSNRKGRSCGAAMMPPTDLHQETLNWGNVFFQGFQLCLVISICKASMHQKTSKRERANSPHTCFFPCRVLQRLHAKVRQLPCSRLLSKAIISRKSLTFNRKCESSNHQPFVLLPVHIKPSPLARVVLHLEKRIKNFTFSDVPFISDSQADPSFFSPRYFCNKESTRAMCRVA